MHDLNALKHSLIKELSEYGQKGGLSSSSLDMIDKLAHAAKNVIKVIECCDGEEYGKAEEHSDSDSFVYYIRPDGSYDEHTKEKLREMIDRL